MIQRIKKLREALDIFLFIEKISGKRPPLLVRNLIIFCFGAALAGLIVVYLNRSTDWPKEQVFMSGIFILASWLWLTEAVPLFATAVMIIGLQVLLLGNPGGWPSLGFTEGGPDYRYFLSPISDPVIILFFGGFMLALATVKEGVDKALAGKLLSIFGSKPNAVLMGMMAVTAIFSMWMSNTATAAMMITLSIPLMAQIPPNEPFRRGMLLAIPFAANIGGMGTPISSPPNAVAVAYLRNAGIDISFFEWTGLMIPIWLSLLVMVYFLILRFYPPAVSFQSFKLEKTEIDPRGWFVIAIFATTVFLWLTDFFHGLPPAVVALIPTVVFTATGLITTRDLRVIDWHILLLIAGGIGLGAGMQATGLDLRILEAIPVDSPIISWLILMVALALSSFISNTAAANLLIPLALALSYQLEGYGAAALVIGVALMASGAMILPVSTPPNAMAYAKGELKAKDFLMTGSLVGIVALLLVGLYLKFIAQLGLI